MEFVKIEDLIGYQIKGLWGEEFDGSFHCTPVIKTNNMNYDGTIDLDNLTYRYIKHDSILENYLQKGDLLIEKSGGTKTHSVGYVTYFDGEEKKYVCNNFILGLRPDTTKINSKYLFYNLRFMYENGNFSDCYNKTTGIQNLKIKLYLAKKIKLIELSKQSEVIEVLDSITKQISSLKSLLENLDKIVKSQFIKMFGTCNEYTNITNCVDIMDHLRKPINSEERMKMQEGILYPYDGATGQVGYVHDYLSDFEGLCIAEDCGNYKAGEESAYIVKGKIWVNNHAHLLKCKDDYNLYFLKEFLFQTDLSEYVNGATRQKLTQSKLREIKVLNPSLELQNKFADYVQQIDKSKFIVQKQIKLLEELLEKKMNEYFGQ